MVPLDPVPYPIDHLPGRGAPSAIALEDRAGTLDFAALEAAVGGVAAWLASRGFMAGDRVASWLPKTRLACVLPLAVARAGLVHVPINPMLKRAQVAHIVADSAAALLISQPARLATLEAGDHPPSCRLAIEDDVSSVDVLPPSTAEPDGLAAILYTSGSTGRPKGVMLSHANLWLGAISVAHYLRLEADDKTLCVLPFSFDYGQNQLFSTWAAGGCVVPLDYLTPRDVIKAVERFAPTTLAGVPPLWVQLLETNWPDDTARRLKRLTNSGGAMTVRMVRDLRARFPDAKLFAMYGITEAFRSTYLDPALIDEHPESMGRAIPFAEVMAVRADGTRAPAGEPGELVHAGPLVSMGYWRDAARMVERYRPAPPYFTMGGTAVFSGDQVVETADGLFRFVGRVDEMIKSAGNRISPTEVEEAVLAAGDVAEAVAVGIPDPRLGQVIAVIGRAVGDPTTVEQGLRARLRRDLPNFMQPAEYHWRETLPRNANGKIDRVLLKNELTS